MGRRKEFGVRLEVRLDERLYARLLEMARIGGRTLSDEVRSVLRHYVVDSDLKAAARAMERRSQSGAAPAP